MKARHRIKLAAIIFIFIISFLIFLDIRGKTAAKNLDINEQGEKVRVDKRRVNTLLNILDKHSAWLNEIKSYVNTKKLVDGLVKKYQSEIDKYFDLSNSGQLIVNEKFMHMLENLNEQEGLNNELNVTERIKNVVFVSAGNAEFFKPLIHSVRLKNIFFPTNKMVIYDLGMSSAMLHQLIAICECDVKKFEFEAYPAHFKNLQTYSWKPIIVKA